MKENAVLCRDGSRPSLQQVLLPLYQPLGLLDWHQQLPVEPVETGPGRPGH